MVKIIPVTTIDAPENDEITPEKLVSGAGRTKHWHAFSDATERFHVGHWSSGPCELFVNYTEDELCVIVKGSVTLTSQEGEEATFNEGQSFVIPAGFVGTWKSNDHVTKIYASFE